MKGLGDYLENYIGLVPSELFRAVKPVHCFAAENRGHMTKEFISLDGTTLPDILPLRSIFYGEGVFETFRWKGDFPALWDRHLERMRKGAELLAIPFPDGQYIGERLKRAVSEAGITDARVKVCLVSRGSSTFYEYPEGSSILVAVKHYESSKEALRLSLSSFRRSSSSPVISIKSLNYLDNILARREANACGFDEALFLNERGNVAECSTSNIFFLKGAGLYTPSIDCGLLPGVIRRAVIELAPRLGYRVVEGKFDLSNLLPSRLVFLTNSVIGATLVSQVDTSILAPDTEVFSAIKRSLSERLRWI